MIAVWLLALAASGPPATLEACDAATLGPEPGPGAYTCYATIDRAQPDVDVVGHLEALVLEHPDDGRLWMTLGGQQLDAGIDCEPALRQAIEVLSAAGENRYRVQAHLNLANRLELSGDVNGALEQLALASSVAETTGHRLLQTVAALEQQRAIIRFAAGDIVAAKAELEALLRELPAEAPPMVRQRLLVGIRDAAVNLGRPREALRWSAALVEAARGAHDDYVLASALTTRALDAHELAEARHAASADAELRAALADALRVAESSGNRFVQTTATLELAEIAPRASRAGLFERCAALAQEVGDEDRRARCGAGRAVALAPNDPAAARAVADALSERVRELDVAELSVHAHRAGGAIAMAQDDVDAAWSHWTAMLHALDERRDAQTSRAARRSVHADRIAWFRRVAGDLLEAGHHQRALVVLEWMRARDAKEWSAAVRLEPSPRPEVTLAQVQSVLAPKEALVAFLVDEPHSWALLVSPQDVRAVKLAGASWLGPAARMTAALLAERDAAVPSTRLYEVLLAPVLEHLEADVEHLVVVGDDPLTRLPLAALPTKDGRVLDRVSISTAPSAGMWTSLRTETSKAPNRGVLALADPPTRQNPLAARWPLPPLPGARAEAEYAFARLGGALRLGDDASESALQQASAYTVLHIGAHVVIDTERPEASAVLLAGDEETDGVASALELGQLDLDGSLVVLAACQGADGRLLEGEGPLSPARALFVGGARTVVAGLWPVRDVDASHLFQRFYAHLDQGVPVAEALARAQRELRDTGAPASAWAGFVVIGDGGFALPRRDRVPPLGWAALAAFAAGALAYGVQRPKRKKLARG